MTHPTHKTRFSDSSIYDEICDLCGATDAYGRLKELNEPCPRSAVEKPMRKWQSTFRVGDYKCEMTISEDGSVGAEWSPDVPHDLTEQQAAQYRAGRDALLAEIGKDMGGSVLVVET